MIQYYPASLKLSGSQPRKKKTCYHWTLSDTVQSVDQFKKLSKLAADATGGMATTGAEAPRPFSEGLLLDLVQKRWVAGKENEAGSLT
jgi:hypothetical protein